MADTLKHVTVGTELTQAEFESGSLHSINGSTAYTVMFSTMTDVGGASWVIDEDTMVSNSTAKVPTQQSVKAYADGIAAGGAAGALYILVASHDATAAEKALATATYTCDGTSDETEINAAITAVNAAGGGNVILTAGSYHPDHSIVLKSHVHLWMTGARIEWSTVDVLFEAIGTEGASTLLTSSAAVGDISVAVADSGIVSVDDYVVIGDDGHTVSTDDDGEIHRVISKADATHAKLDADLWMAHTTANTAFMMKLNMVHDIEIHGGYVWGADGDSTDAIYLLNFLYVADFKIEGMQVENIPRMAFGFYSAVRGEVAGNRVWGTANTTGYGLSLYGACTHVNIHHNYFGYFRHAFTGNAYAAHHGSPMYCSFNNNICVGEYDDTGSAIIDLHTCNAQGLTFDNNILLGGYNSSGFNVGASQWSASGNIVSVDNFAFKDRNDHDSVKSVTLKNNIVIRGGGVVLNGVGLDRVIIDGLDVYSPTSYVVDLDTAAANSFAQVSNVVCRTNPADNATAIRIVDYAEVLVTNNAIRGVSNNPGITIEDATEGLVANNMVANCQYGIYLNNSSYIHLTGNHLYDDGAGTQLYGVYEAGTANNNTIVNNKCWGNVTAAYLIIGAATLCVEPEAKGLTFWNTVDSAAVANEVTYGAYDLAAGRRAPAISSEETVVAGTTQTISGYYTMRINGATIHFATCTT